MSRERFSFEGWEIFDSRESAILGVPDAVDVVFKLDGREIDRKRMDFDAWDELLEQWERSA